MRVHRGWVEVAVGARAGCRGRRRTHVQADGQMGVIQLRGTAGGVVRDVEVRYQGERSLVCDDVFHRGVTRGSSKGVSLLSWAPV